MAVLGPPLRLRVPKSAGILWHNIDLHTKFQHKILIFGALAGCSTVAQKWQNDFRLIFQGIAKSS